MFSEISQSSQESYCARVPFFKKFCKISKNTFFHKTSLVAASESLAKYVRFVPLVLLLNVCSFWPQLPGRDFSGLAQQWVSRKGKVWVLLSKSNIFIGFFMKISWVSIIFFHWLLQDWWQYCKMDEPFLVFVSVF